MAVEIILIISTSFTPLFEEIILCLLGYTMLHENRFILVGAGRFELPTSWSQTMRADQLRHAPTLTPPTHIYLG